MQNCATQQTIIRAGLDQRKPVVWKLMQEYEQQCLRHADTPDPMGALDKAIETLKEDDSRFLRIIGMLADVGYLHMCESYSD